MATRWCEQRVMAMSDCLCGALDGINEAGLAVSLSFGGRKEVGPGFGIPLVLRYVLEFAESVREATAMLAKIPVHMTYSISLLDRHGEAATVFVAPDRPAEVLAACPLTNHQGGVEWEQHAAATRTVLRLGALETAIRAAKTLEDLITSMLTPPLYQASYTRGYGTLYTAVYRPNRAGRANPPSGELIWPARRWRQTVTGFTPGKVSVAFQEQEETAGA